MQLNLHGYESVYLILSSIKDLYDSKEFKVLNGLKNLKEEYILNPKHLNL